MSRAIVVAVIVVGSLFAASERSGAAPGPSLSVIPRQGPADSAIEIDGTGFKPFEPVSVHIFTTHEVRTARADGKGSFISAFYIVRNEFPGGDHEIWAVGNNSGRRAQTTFRLLPTVESDADSGMVGDNESGGLREFGPEDHVVVTLWRSGRVESELGTFATSTRGGGPFHWKVPEVPGGRYELEAAGERSGLVATTPFLVRPSITPLPDNAAPTQKVDVKGTGFDASSSVTVYLNDIGNGGQRNAIDTVTTDSKGSFYFTFSVPHVPGGSDVTLESDVVPSVGGKVESPFDVNALLGAGPSEVNPPDALCQSTGQPEPSPTQLTMIGAGFGPDSVVTLDLVSDSTGASRRIGTARTDDAGDFTTTLTVPAAPYGKYAVRGEGKTFYGSDDRAFSRTISVGFDACDNLSESGGSVTDQWQGVGTDANSPVKVILDGSPVMETTADANGSWAVGPKTFACSMESHTYGIEVKLGGQEATFTAPLVCGAQENIYRA